MPPSIRSLKTELLKLPFPRPDERVRRTGSQENRAPHRGLALARCDVSPPAPVTPARLPSRVGVRGGHAGLFLLRSIRGETFAGKSPSEAAFSCGTGRAQAAAAALHLLGRQAGRASPPPGARGGRGPGRGEARALRPAERAPGACPAQRAPLPPPRRRPRSATDPPGAGTSAPRTAGHALGRPWLVHPQGSPRPRRIPRSVRGRRGARLRSPASGQRAPV